MENAAVHEEQRAHTVVLILCGLVGSGKSTFSKALQREFPEFRRCNQDELGKRENVERAVRASLSRGFSVCVDRTNIDPSQRRTWIEIARQYPNVEIWGLQLDTPYDMCRTRLIKRQDHPKIKTPDVALRVLRQFSSEFVPIDPEEGFNRVLRLSPHHSPDYTREELENILAAIRETPFFDNPLFLPPAPTPSRGRGLGSHPFRGRGRGSTYHNQGYQSHGWRPHQQSYVSGSNPASSWEPRVDSRANFQGGWGAQDPAHRGYGFHAYDQRPHSHGYMTRGRGCGYNRGHGPSPRHGGSDRAAYTPPPTHPQSGSTQAADLQVAPTTDEAASLGSDVLGPI